MLGDVKSNTGRLNEWLLRSLIGSLMLLAFKIVISFGSPALVALCLLVQLICFREVDNIGRSFCRCDANRSSLFSFYFLFVADYFYLFDLFIADSSPFLMLLSQHRRLISLALYSLGLLAYSKWFARPRDDQLAYLAYIHLEVLVALQVASSIRATLVAPIWFILPVSMTVCNDIMAYVFGVLIGRTRLIEVSPKKTREGFLCSALFTIMIGQILAYKLSSVDSMLCYQQCHQTNLLFQLKQYSIFNSTFNFYPFQFHAALFSLFVSLIGPFGGFFASGFKRSFGLKDFSSSLPGHGGFMDRIDCIPLVMSFVVAYMDTFILSTAPYDLFHDFVRLDENDKQMLLHLINSSRIKLKIK